MKLKVANAGLVVALIGIFVAPWWLTMTGVLVSMHLAWRGTCDLVERDR